MITLLTDFGLEDAYVGVVKGVLLSISPSATIVDISHNIAPQDVAGAAYLLETAFEYFPPGTVHVVVVDPGVGSERSIVAVEVKGYRFLAPDNGVLTAVLSKGPAERAVAIENTEFFLHPVSRTFHGRDIFAPVAAHLAMGLDMATLGPIAPLEKLVRLRLPQPVFDDPLEIIGEVIASDRFGNLITNIGEGDLASLLGKSDPSSLTICISGRAIHGVSDNYVSVASGELLAIIGSSGRMEISINGGNAAVFLGAGVGEELRIKNRSSDLLPII